jgi:hypothetical protein
LSRRGRVDGRPGEADRAKPCSDERQATDRSSQCHTHFANLSIAAREQADSFNQTGRADLGCVGMATTRTVAVVAHNGKTLGARKRVRAPRARVRVGGRRLPGARVSQLPKPNGAPAAPQVDCPVRADRAASEEALS